MMGWIAKYWRFVLLLLLTAIVGAVLIWVLLSDPV